MASLTSKNESNESNNESKDNWSNDYKSENIIIFQNETPLPQIQRIRPYGFSANYQTVPIPDDVDAWDRLTSRTLDTKDKYLLLSVHPRNWVYYITNSKS